MFDFLNDCEKNHVSDVHLPFSRNVLHADCTIRAQLWPIDHAFQNTFAKFQSDREKRRDVGARCISVADDSPIHVVTRKKKERKSTQSGLHVSKNSAADADADEGFSFYGTR